MKAIAGIGLLALLGMLGYWYATTTSDTESAAINIPLAFGNVSGPQVDMHIVVGVALANVSAAKDPSLKSKSWDDWIRDHFSLTDSAGKKVTLRRQSSSKVIKAHEVAQVVGTEEFFIVANLKVGQRYTLDYIGDVTTRKTYRCEVTAPSAPEKVQTYRLEPLDAGR